MGTKTKKAWEAIRTLLDIHGLVDFIAKLVFGTGGSSIATGAIDQAVPFSQRGFWLFWAGWFLLFLLISPYVFQVVRYWWGKWWILEPRPAWDSKNLEVIGNRRFQNQSVELDGRFYSHCEFENVTFVYHGRAPFSFDSEIKGSWRLDIRMPQFGDILRLLQEFKMLHPEIRVGEREGRLEFKRERITVNPPPRP